MSAEAADRADLLASFRSGRTNLDSRLRERSLTKQWPAREYPELHQSRGGVKCKSQKLLETQTFVISSPSSASSLRRLLQPKSLTIISQSETDKPNVEVSWQVTGVRHDAFAKAHPLQVSVDKPDGARLLSPSRAVRGFGREERHLGAPHGKDEEHESARIPVAAFKQAITISLDLPEVARVVGKSRNFRLRCFGISYRSG